MPSAEDTSYLQFEVMSSPDHQYRHHHHHHHHRDLTTRDVDVLVSRIKENLRLSSNFKAKSSVVGGKSRATPYKLPAGVVASRTSSAMNCDYCCSGVGAGTGGQNNGDGTNNNNSCRHHLAIPRRFLTGADDCSAGDYTVQDLEDSNERFQALLRDGALIKEAVKRLRKLSWYCSSENGMIEIAGGDSQTQTTSCMLDRRKQYYYDEEDDVSCSPIEF